MFCTSAIPRQRIVCFSYFSKTRKVVQLNVFIYQKMCYAHVVTCLLNHSASQHITLKSIIPCTEHIQYRMTAVISTESSLAKVPGFRLAPKVLSLVMFNQPYVLNWMQISGWKQRGQINCKLFVLTRCGAHILGHCPFFQIKVKSAQRLDEVSLLTTLLIVW